MNQQVQNGLIVIGKLISLGYILNRMLVNRNFMQETIFANNIDVQRRFNISAIINRYLNCPRFFQIADIGKQRSIFGEMLDGMRFGIFLHRVASDYLQQQDSQRNWENLKSYYTNKFNKLNFADNESWHDKYLKSFEKFHRDFKNMRTILNETGHKLLIENCLLGGAIDCVVENPETKDIWLVDFKMSNKDFYNPENFKHKYLQLIFYYLLVKDKFRALVDLNRL